MDPGGVGEVRGQNLDDSLVADFLAISILWP